MRKLIGVIMVVGVGLMLVVTAALAHPWRGHHAPAKHGLALLSGGQEVPAVQTDARGVGQFHLRKHNGTQGIRYHLGVRKIDNVVAAHIHCAKRGENGPIVADLYPATGAETKTPGKGWTVRGTVTAVKAGVKCKLRDGSETEVATLSDLVKLMRHGLTYANVHTTDFPSGEARGQIRMHRGWWRR